MPGLIEKETLISCELCDPKIPNPKHQITNKFQIMITNTRRTRGAHAAQALALRERLRCA